MGEEEQFNKHLSDRIKHEIVRAEIEGGVDVEKIPEGKGLVIHTQNSVYKLEHRQEGWFLSGGDYYPEPILVKINGSTAGGSMLWSNRIIRGNKLEVKILNPEVKRNIFTTSSIKEIIEITL